MPSDCIFCTTYKQYYSSTDFVTNHLRAPYKTCKSYKVILFFPSFYDLSNSIYIGEKKGPVLTIFGGPSAAYKLTYFRYYFRCYFCCCFRCYFRRCFYCYFSLYFLPPYTACINLATPYYSPPYYGPVRY